MDRTVSDASVKEAENGQEKPSSWTESFVQDAFGKSAGAARDRKPETGDKQLAPRLALDGEEKPLLLKPGDHDYSVVADGNERRFQVHVPKNYDGSEPIPVMYMLPGVGGSIAQMKHESGMNNVADQKGFAVVYVEPLPKAQPKTSGLITANSWNLDHGCLTEKDKSYDDLNYFKAVDSKLTKILNVDKTAQYIAGFSEGGGVAQYVAESMPGTFAGIGSVHGTHLKSDLVPSANDKAAFISIHGDSDHMLPYEGGRGLMTVHMPRVAESEPAEQVKIWAAANDAVEKRVLDSSDRTVSVYRCKDGPAAMEIVRKMRGGIPVPFSGWHNFGTGGQHALDGKGLDGKGDFGWALIGKPDTARNTSADLANFLLNYRRKDGTLVIQRDFTAKAPASLDRGLGKIMRDLKKAVPGDGG